MFPVLSYRNKAMSETGKTLLSGAYLALIHTSQQSPFPQCNLGSCFSRVFVTYKSIMLKDSCVPCMLFCLTKVPFSLPY